MTVAALRRCGAAVRGPLGVPAFRWLSAGQVVSAVGDQLLPVPLVPGVRGLGASAAEPPALTRRPRPGDLLLRPAGVAHVTPCAKPDCRRVALRSVMAAGAHAAAPEGDP